MELAPRPSVYQPTDEETAMGILGKILAGKMMASAVDRMSRRNDTSVATTGAEGQYIPASRSGTSLGLPASMGSIVDRAGEFYRANPKKVHAMGAVAAAILLARMGQRR
jgi:hypothetical protein